jgi:DNA-binding protein H-NS
MAKAGSIDLSKLSIEELQILARDIEAEIQGRREADRERVRQQMLELANSVGMTVQEILGGRAGRAEVRYRHPENPSLTWSGRGKRPHWVTEALSSGKTLDDLAATET